MHVLVKVFNLFNFFKFCNRHESHSRDEHGSGLDRTGSDWIGLDQDWIRTEANFGRIWTGSDYNFLKIGGSGLYRTEKIFFVSMLLF